MVKKKNIMDISSYIVKKCVFLQFSFLSMKLLVTLSCNNDGVKGFNLKQFSCIQCYMIISHKQCASVSCTAIGTAAESSELCCLAMVYALLIHSTQKP